MAFDNIKLEKGLYTTGKSFTDALEAIDPSENYEGTALEGLDAYERQLKRFDIKVSGAKSDTVSKFFATTDSAALFPEYISRAVRTGMESSSTVDEIVACTTEIDSLDYRSIKTAVTTDDLTLSETKEGEEFTEIAISASDNLTTLVKHGKLLSASYEAIKFQKLDLFTTVLRQIGSQIARTEFNQAIETIDSSKSGSVTSASSAIAYSDLVSLWASLEPYNMNRLVVSKNMIASILALPEFRDSYAGLTFHGTGKLITPLGAQIYICDSIDDSTVIGLDKNYAFEKVQAGGVLTEFDKLIDRQLERAAISTITGFSTIYDEAVSLLSVTG